MAPESMDFDIETPDFLLDARAAVAVPATFVQEYLAGRSLLAVLLRRIGEPVTVTDEDMESVDPSRIRVEVSENGTAATFSYEEEA